MSFDNCKICPALIPPCPVCNSGQTCVIIEQSCHVCSYTECLDNAQVSSGHYTIGSTGALGPISTEHPGGSSSSASGSSQSTTVSTTSDNTSTSSISSTSSMSNTAAASTSNSGASTTSTTSTSSAAAISNSLSSIASSISTEASSVTSSPTATPSTGVAAMIGPHAMDGQGLVWIVMAFWLGTALFGGRRWRL